MASAVDDDVRAAAGKFDRTIVEGSLGHAVWRLAWPTMVQNIIGIHRVAARERLTVPHSLLAVFGMTDGHVVALGRQPLAYLAVSGLFVTVALTYTGGLQGTGGPLYISMASQVLVPIGFCAALQAMRGLQASDIWLAIVIGHFTRGALSVLRFRQGKWREITVDIRPARWSSKPSENTAMTAASRVAPSASESKQSSSVAR